MLSSWQSCDRGPGGLGLLRAITPVPFTQLGVGVGHLHLYFLTPLEWGLEKAKTMSELFPTRASASRTGPDTGMCLGDVSWRKKGLFCPCDEFCKDWDRSAGSREWQSPLAEGRIG